MTRTLVVLIAAALAVPAATSAQTNPKPPSGKYKLYFGGTGSVKVKDKKLVSAAIVPDDDTACGTTKVTLKGTPYPLSIATRGGYRLWIVGKNTPTKGDGYSLIKAKFLIDGQTVKGKVKMIWHDDNAKSGSGTFAYGNCEAEFSFAPSK